MKNSRDISIHFPPKLIFGKGKTDQLIDEVLHLGGNNVMIITIEPLLSQLEPIIQQLRDAFIEVCVDTSIVQEPFFSDFEKLVRKVSPFNPDVVIGIGGGSVLDIAKLVSAQLRNEQTLAEYVGIDALTHCLEAYTNKFAHPMIDLYAYKGMQLISGNIAEAVKNGNNEEARIRRKHMHSRIFLMY